MAGGVPDPDAHSRPHLLAPASPVSPRGAGPAHSPRGTRARLPWASGVRAGGDTRCRVEAGRGFSSGNWTVACLGLLAVSAIPGAASLPQVSHHPPVSAFHVSNRKDGFCISGSVTAKSRFYGEGLPWAYPRASGDGEDWAPRFLRWWPGGLMPASPAQGARGWESR